MPRRQPDPGAQPFRVREATDVADLDYLLKLEEVDDLARQGPRVTVNGTDAVLARVAADLVAHGIVPMDLEVKRASLEDVFLAITGEER